MTENEDAESPGFGRREALARLGVGGAVGATMWAAPSILTFASSAAAAGTCPKPTLDAFSTWTATNSGGFNPGTGILGYVNPPPSPYPNKPTHLVEQDPPVINGSATFTTPNSFQLVAGRTYTFDVEYFWRNGGDHNTKQVLTAELFVAGTGVLAKSQEILQTTKSGSTHTGNGPLTFTPTSTGTYNFRYLHTFKDKTGGGKVIANDIAVYPPVISCST